MKSAPLIELLSSIATPVIKTLKKEETLFRQGDVVTHIYAVKEGCVKLVRYTIEGCAATMHTAHTGESFSEAALFSKIYHCDAVAHSSSIVLCYPKNQVLEILQTNAAKSQDYIALLTRQVRSLRTLLELRSVRSARQRIFQFLLLQADPRNLEVTVKGAYKDMAHELGLTHESFYRSLAKLEKEGTIQRTPSTIKILKNSLV